MAPRCWPTQRHYSRRASLLGAASSTAARAGRASSGTWSRAAAGRAAALAQRNQQQSRQLKSRLTEVLIRVWLVPA
jgi:hypothetical protein